LFSDIKGGLRVFENRVLRRPFGPKRDEMTGGKRKLHIKGLHNVCPSSSIIRIINSRRQYQQGNASRMGERNKNRGEGKRPLGRTRRSWWLLKWTIDW
jgi:hypothetical protein